MTERLSSDYAWFCEYFDTFYCLFRAQNFSARGFVPPHVCTGKKIYKIT